jgi:thymidine kinase
MAKLYFYYSAMNAGKSTMLLQSSYNYRERGMDTLLFSPTIDTRFGVGKIASRIGLDTPAVNFDAQFNFYRYVRDAIKKPDHKIQCILVDEAQFLTKKQVKQLKYITDHLSLPILAYGLRTDYMGEPFEGSRYLLAWAETLVEIKTVCHCGRKATMNLRIDEHGEPIRTGKQVDIGGNDKYIATCYKHFVEGIDDPDLL